MKHVSLIYLFILILVLPSKAYEIFFDKIRNHLHINSWENPIDRRPYTLKSKNDIPDLPILIFEVIDINDKTRKMRIPPNQYVEVKDERCTVKVVGDYNYRAIIVGGRPFLSAYDYVRDDGVETITFKESSSINKP